MFACLMPWMIRSRIFLVGGNIPDTLRGGYDIPLCDALDLLSVSLLNFLCCLLQSEGVGLFLPNLYLLLTSVRGTPNPLE